MKKFFIALCAFALLLPTALGLVACDSGSNNGGTNKLTSTQKARNIYAYSAVIGANYFNSMSSTSLTNSSLLSATDASEISKEIQAELTAGIKMFDELIESGGITVTTALHGDADYSDYKFKMTVSLPGNETVLIYFNEKNSENKNLDKVYDEIEYSTTLDGVVVYGESEYLVEGERTYEQDKGETESEIEFKIYVDNKNKDFNYVKLSQETETEANKSEMEYELEVFSNGTTIFECEIEFEVENGQLELEFEIEQATGVELSKRKYKIKPGSASNTYVVTYKDETNDSRVTINVTKINDGAYTFAYPTE